MQDAAVPLVLPFTAGMLAFINPCGVAMLPAYVSYYLGLSSTSTGKPLSPRLVARGVLLGVLATAGFMAVFGGAGMVFSLAGSWLIKYVPWLASVVGAGVALLGAALALGKTSLARIPQPDAGNLLRGGGMRLFAAFGVAYAIASLSCTIPVFLYVALIAISAGGFISGMAVFLAYSLGMGASMTAFSVLMVVASRLASRILVPISRYSLRIAGLVMIASGAYIVYFQVFVGGLIDWLPA